MNRYRSGLRRLAVALAILAGFVDAIGFLEFGGFFVSFMSGNSTRLGVALASGSSLALFAAGLIVAFVCGVAVASLLAAGAGYRRRRMVLALVAGLLALALLIHPVAPAWATTFMMAAAMGAENGTFEQDGEVTVGVTYMTGALVRTGQRIAAALRGGDPIGWLPNLQLWLGLAAGAASGAFAHGRIGLSSLWLAVAAAAGLSVVAGRIDRETRG